MAVASAVRMSIALRSGAQAHSEPVVLPATIVWCARVGEGYQVGARFSGVTTQLRGLLARCANHPV
jgi:hypothetical protein